MVPESHVTLGKDLFTGQSNFLCNFILDWYALHMSHVNSKISDVLLLWETLRQWNIEVQTLITI